MRQPCQKSFWDCGVAWETKAYLIGSNLDKYVEGNGEYVNVDTSIFNELEGYLPADVAQHIGHIGLKSDNHLVQGFFQVLSEINKSEAYGG